MSWRIGKLQLTYAPRLAKVIVKRDLKKLGIVKGKPLFHDMGKSGEEFAIEGWVLSDRDYQLLKQMADNGEYQPVYVSNCPERYEGHYYMQQEDLGQKGGIVSTFDYKFKFWKVGTRQNLMEGVFAAQDALSLDSKLTDADIDFRVISLPTGAKHLLIDNTPMSGIDFTRSGADGSTPCMKRTTGSESIVLYNQDLSDMYKGECKVFDTRNEGSESNWYEVLDDEHVFTGKVVVQNNILRVRQPTGNEFLDHYWWQSSSWNDSDLHFDDDTEGNPPVNFSFNRLSREEVDLIVRWESGLWRRYKIRRGQPFFEYSDIFTRGHRGDTFKLTMEWDADHHQYVAWIWDSGGPTVREENSFTGSDTNLLLADGESYAMTDIWFAMYKKSSPWTGQFVAMNRQPIDGKVDGSANDITKIVLTWDAEPKLFIGAYRDDFTGSPPGTLTDMSSHDVSIKFRAIEAMHEHTFTRRLNNRAWTVL